MTPDEKRVFALSHPVHVGVDTGKKFHVLLARGPDGKRARPFKVDVSRAGFAAAITHLKELYPTVPLTRMLVGLEFAGHHGFTFAAFLAQKGCPVVSVLPANTKRTKELEDNSPLKSDAKDAAVICRLTGDGTFVRFPFLQHPYRELRLLTTQRHRLSVECARFKNRLQGVLDLAWPEFRVTFKKINKDTAREVLRRWPLPHELAAARPSLVRSVIRTTSRGQVKAPKIAALLAGAKTTIALRDAHPERRLEITNLLDRWRFTEAQQEELEARIEALVELCPEAKILMTVPKVGAVCAGTIVAELGTPQDFEYPRQILKLAGMNLVYHSSGNINPERAVKWQSKRGRPALRRQLYLLAGRWCQKKAKGPFRPDYEALMARNGGLKKKTLASMARKIVPILFAVMRSGKPFDEAVWRANRRTPMAA
jgi:transposase